jgi:hypothetical protein
LNASLNAFAILPGTNVAGLCWLHAIQDRDAGIQLSESGVVSSLRAMAVAITGMTN